MSTLRVSHVKTRDDVVWVVFLCCGVCVCVCVCEPSSYEAQRESPARPRPGRSIAAPFRVCAFSRAFRQSCPPRLPPAKLPRARSVQLRVWSSPSSRSSAACLALGDNLVTGPRGRKLVIVRATPVPGPSTSLSLPVLSPSSAPPVYCPLLPLPRRPTCGLRSRRIRLTRRPLRLS